MLKQFDVRSQSDAHVCPFNQVVAEQRFQREAVFCNSVKRFHVVDRLAMENSFQEKVLLGVGNRLAVWIGSRSVREDTREARRRGSR